MRAGFTARAAVRRQQACLEDSNGPHYLAVKEYVLIHTSKVVNVFSERGGR